MWAGVKSCSCPTVILMCLMFLSVSEEVTRGQKGCANHTLLTLFNFSNTKTSRSNMLLTSQLLAQALSIVN